MFIFPVQLTTSRIGNLTRSIHTLLYVMTIHTYIPYIMCVSPVSLLRVTLCVHFAAARDAEARRARQQQRRNAAATAAAALQARYEETTRLAGEYKGECVTSNFFVERTALCCLLAAVCCLVTYRNVSLLRVLLRLRFVAARDTEKPASSATATGTRLGYAQKV